MTHTWTAGEAIVVQSSAGGGTEDRPLVILWKGTRHNVLQIVESWEIHTDWWESGGVIRRTYHAVQTSGGLFCVIYRDLEGGDWYLAKVYD